MLVATLTSSKIFYNPLKNERLFYRSKNPSTTDQERLKMNVLRWTIAELRRQ